jgi:predicted amidohydrolase
MAGAGGAAEVGIVQLEGGPLDADRARETTVTAAAALFEQGADLVVLPELAVPGYVLGAPEFAALAEPLGGPTVGAWTELAAAHGGLVCGGFAERDGDLLYNTAVLVDGDGVVVHYRKLHPFDREKLVFAPGDRGLPVADTRLGRIGVCVCYDLRFVETARLLALQDADLICVPTAWTGGFDPDGDEADPIPQAQGAMLQANLNQVFLACASVGGRHEETVFLGSSLVVDPWGKALVGPLSKTDPGRELVRLELGDAVASRVRGPLISPRQDRRTDVYGLLLDGETL